MQKQPGYEPLVALEVSKVSVPRPEAAPTMDTVQQETDLQIGIKCASFLFITPSTEKVRSFTPSFFPGFKFETANVPETLGTPRACPNTTLLPKDAKDAKDANLGRNSLAQTNYFTFAADRLATAMILSGPSL